MTKHDAIVALGREIRRRRKAQGLTLERLGEAAGLTPNYIGTIEAGQRDPSLSSMIRLAKAFDSPIGELLGAPRARVARPPRPYCAGAGLNRQSVG